MLDSLNVLNAGVVSAVIFASRLNRRSPIPGALSFIAGVFTVTTTFGLCMVLGLSFLTSLVDFRVTPAVRFRGELVLGLVLICLAYFPLAAQSSAPGWAMAAMRERPWLLGLLGMAVGIGQAPTDVPYLTGLAMLAALHPRPPIWPVLDLPLLRDRTVAVTADPCSRDEANRTSRAHSASARPRPHPLRADISAAAVLGFWCRARRRCARQSQRALVGTKS